MFPLPFGKIKCLLHKKKRNQQQLSIRRFGTFDQAAIQHHHQLAKESLRRYISQQHKLFVTIHSFPFSSSIRLIRQAIIPLILSFELSILSVHPFLTFYSFFLLYLPLTLTSRLLSACSLLTLIPPRSHTNAHSDLQACTFYRALVTSNKNDIEENERENGEATKQRIHSKSKHEDASYNNYFTFMSF
jgi:hypothetical protein